MRVLHLSWEYPPVVYGGLGRHVHALAEAQAAAGHDVVVVSQGQAGTPADEVVNGVRVVRVTPESPLADFGSQALLPWVTALDHAMARTAVRLLGEWRPEVVHGHDWLVAHAAATLKEAAGIPLVVTIHATEAGRHQGWLPTPLSRAIHSVESWFTYEARRVIVCSSHMRWEVTRLFDLPATDVDVIPNGIDLGTWVLPTPAQREAVRRGLAADGPLVVFHGRLEWEKGVHTLVDAVPALRRRFPRLRVVVAGRGSTADDLAAQAHRLGVDDALTFTGWMPEGDLHALVAAADVAVVPSIYEPFGLVALEAAALGAPLVVSETGGLAEFVRPGETGWTYPPGQVGPLVAAVTDALVDREAAGRQAAEALRRLFADHGWDRVAGRTVDTYRRALLEQAAADLADTGPERFALELREGNLLRDETA